MIPARHSLGTTAIVISPEKSVHGIYELAASGSDLGQALARNLLEQALAFGQQRYERSAAIVLLARAGYVLMLLHTIDQFDRSVVPESHPLGQRLNGRLGAFGKSTKGEQQLKLLRLEACAVGGGIGFPEKLAQEVTQGSESTVVGGRDWHALLLYRIAILRVH